MRNFRISILSILATTVLSAADISVGASSPASVAPGGTATVPVSYSAKGAQLVALSFDLLFDKTNLTITADAGAAATAAKKGVTTSDLPGGIRVLVLGTNILDLTLLGDGAVVTLTVKAASTASGTLQLQFANATGSDSTGKSATLTPTGGSITVTGGGGGGGAALSIGAGTPVAVSPGGTVTVPVSYSAKGAQLVALSFDLLFDKTNLTITADIGAAATAAKKGVQSSDLPGGIRVLVLGTNLLDLTPLGDGAVVTLTIKAASTASGTLQLQLANATGSDATGKSAALSTTGGSVTAGGGSGNVSGGARLRFVPLTPCRVMETRPQFNFEGRTGPFGPPSLNAAETRTLNLPVSNVCAIPGNAKAYVVNVTLIPASTVDFVTVFPAGDARPNVWTIRSPDGQTVANSSIVSAGVNGGISVFSSQQADLLIDISGYYTDSTGVAGLAYYPLFPCRVIDTRIAFRPTGPFGAPSMGAQETRKFRFPDTPFCKVPAAAAYSVTITAVPQGILPFLTAWPDGGPQPNVSSLNSFAGRVLANSVIVPASADGSIDVFTFAATDFLVDINGYYAPDDGQTGLFYYTVPQCRASDSTVSGGIFADDSTRTINIPAASGCVGIPANAKGYAINVTALPAGNPMPFLTAFPTGQPKPDASILNALQGQIVTNSAIIPAGTNGSIDVYANRRTNVVVEVNGYFSR